MNVSRWLAVVVVAGVLSVPGSASALTRVRTDQWAVPGQVTESRGKPTRVRDWRKLWVRVGGKLTDIADWRDCEADLARRRVLVTVNTCGRRVVVRAVTTGSRRVRVQVKLVAGRPARATRDGFGLR